MRRQPTLIGVLTNIVLGFVILFVVCLMVYNVFVYGMKFISPAMVMASEHENKIDIPEAVEECNSQLEKLEALAIYIKEHKETFGDYYADANTLCTLCTELYTRLAESIKAYGNGQTEENIGAIRAYYHVLIPVCDILDRILNHAGVSCGDYHKPKTKI